MNAITAFIANHPREIGAGVAITSALNDEFKAIHGAIGNISTFIDKGQNVCGGIKQGILNRSFRPIQNVAGDSVQAAIAGVLFITGMFYSEVFKRVALIIGIAQNIFSLNNTNPNPAFSQGRELAKLGINAISLAYELNPSSNLFAAKTISQVAYQAFQAFNNYSNNDTIEAFQATAVGLITGVRGVSKYDKIAKDEAKAAEESKPDTKAPKEEPVVEATPKAPEEEPVVEQTPPEQEESLEQPVQPMPEPQPEEPVLENPIETVLEDMSVEESSEPVLEQEIAELIEDSAAQEPELVVPLPLEIPIVILPVETPEPIMPIPAQQHKYYKTR